MKMNLMKNKKYLQQTFYNRYLYPKLHVQSGVEINTGTLARGQWIFCWASRICFALDRLASEIFNPDFMYMV